MAEGAEKGWKLAYLDENYEEYLEHRTKCNVYLVVSRYGVRYLSYHLSGTETAVEHLIKKSYHVVWSQGT